MSDLKASACEIDPMASHPPKDITLSSSALLSPPDVPIPTSPLATNSFICSTLQKKRKKIH